MSSKPQLLHTGHCLGSVLKYFLGCFRVQKELQTVFSPDILLLFFFNLFNIASNLYILVKINLSRFLLACCGPFVVVVLCKLFVVCRFGDFFTYEVIWRYTVLFTIIINLYINNYIHILRPINYPEMRLEANGMKDHWQ